MAFFSSTKNIHLVEPCYGAHTSVTRSPFLVGSAANCHLRLPSSVAPEVAFSLSRKDGSFSISPHAAGVFVNHQPLAATATLPVDEDCVLHIGSALFYLRVTAKGDKWARSINTKKWVVYSSNGANFGTFPVQAVSQILLTKMTSCAPGESVLTAPSGTQIGSSAILMGGWGR
jgi:predicted component of type VI protein secretion system